MNDKKDCFARKNEFVCNALTEKDCRNCHFYKSRNEIKNNPFYAYSYNDKDKLIRDIKKRGIKSEQMIWK